MQTGIYRNKDGDEINVLYRAATAREFEIIGAVYTAEKIGAAPNRRDLLVTGDGLRRAGYKPVSS